MLPLMLTLCATNAVGFFDRVFLARHSIHALEGYVSGFVLTALFQTALMRFTTMGQAFIGFYNGAQEQHQIGKLV